MTATTKMPCPHCGVKTRTIKVGITQLATTDELKRLGNNWLQPIYYYMRQDYLIQYHTLTYYGNQGESQIIISKHGMMFCYKGQVLGKLGEYTKIGINSEENKLLYRDPDTEKVNIFDYEGVFLA